MDYNSDVFESDPDPKTQKTVPDSSLTFSTLTHHHKSSINDFTWAQIFYDSRPISLLKPWNIEFWILWGRVFGPPNYTKLLYLYFPLKMCILISSHLGQLIQQWNHAIWFDTLLWRFSICFRLSFRRCRSIMTNPDVCDILSFG